MSERDKSFAVASEVLPMSGFLIDKSCQLVEDIHFEFALEPLLEHLLNPGNQFEQIFLPSNLQIPQLPLPGLLLFNSTKILAKHPINPHNDVVHSVRAHVVVAGRYYIPSGCQRFNSLFELDRNVCVGVGRLWHLLLSLVYFCCFLKIFTMEFGVSVEICKEDCLKFLLLVFSAVYF